MSAPRATRRACLLLAMLLACNAACTSTEDRREELLLRASDAAQMGDRGRAIAILSRALDYDPRDRSIATRLARLEMEAGEYADALRVLVSARSNAPADLDYRLLLARNLVHLGRFEEAARHVTSLHRSSEAITRAGHGDALPELMHAFAEQLVARKRRLAENTQVPDELRHLLVRRLVRAQRLDYALVELSRLDPSDPDRAGLIEQVLALAWREDAALVVEPFPELLASARGAEAKLISRAILLERGAHGEASRLERAFLREHPDHPARYEILVTAARRAARLGKTDEALSLAEEAIEAHPDGIDALVERGLALDALGRTEEARRVFRVVQGLAPGNSAAAGFRADYETEMKRRERERTSGLDEGPGLRHLRLEFSASGHTENNP